jgi:hypothetical protein
MFIKGIKKIAMIMKTFSIFCFCFVMVSMAQAQTSDNKLGYFNLEQDLLIANYDSKPDVDDLMSVAAFATMLRDVRFQRLNYIAVAGAYGTQGGNFIQSDHLFDLAFGKRWLNAHEKREEAIREIFIIAKAVIENGGDIWIAEAGQSDVSAALVRLIREYYPFVRTKDRIHLVQHSFWNESVTTPSDFEFVREYTDYTKIPDGNGYGNGTPGFKTNDGVWWTKLPEFESIWNIWKEAGRLSDANNIVAGYNNEAIGLGGFDFSDTAELCWIFGFDRLTGVDDFFQEFLPTH